MAKSFDIKAEKPNTNQSLSSKYQKLKIKHKEQNEKFQCEKSKFLMEIERLETLIDEMQKNRPENLSEKLKATEQECERLRVEISMKCVEIQNFFEVQKSKDVEIGKTKVNCEELKKKMNDIKKQQLEDLKKHQESMKWIKHPPVKKEKILVKTNSRKGMKKELCVSCVEEQHWRKVALELTTKYFSALKTLKDDLNTFKISVQKACSDQVEDFIRSYKRKIKKHIINMEKKAEKS